MATATTDFPVFLNIIGQKRHGLYSLQPIFTHNKYFFIE